jgi:hypothetical protein
MALLLEVCVAVTAWMMVILFWMTYITCSEHLILTPPQGVGGKTNGVPKCFDVTEHTQQEVGTAVCSGDIKVSSVAYVFSSTAKQLLHGVNCDACKESHHIN